MPRKSKWSAKSSSSTSNADPGLVSLDEEKGKALARVLLDELCPSHFPEPRQADKAKWIGELYGVVRLTKDEETSDFQFKSKSKKDSLPQRGGVIDFQTTQKKALPKFVFAPDIAADASFSELFCIGYGGFIPESSISIEHAYPHTKIRNNQARLLDYLNKPENKEIAESFLNHEGISDYIRRDGSDNGKVKGSLYFFKHSYGAMTNLFLLSQAENSSKSTKDLLEWVKNENSSFLGEDFIQHVNAEGGCHGGVLFDRVYHLPNDEDGYISIQLEEGESVILPPPGLAAKGLGQMIREWVKGLNWAIQLHVVNHTELVKRFRQHVNTLIKYFLDGRVDENARGRLIEREQHKLEVEMRELAEIQKTILQKSLERSAFLIYSPNGHPSQSSSGSSDIDDIGTNRKIAAHIKAGEINHYTHRMRTTVKNYYGRELAREIYAYINELPYLNTFDSDHLQSMSRDFSDYLYDLEQRGASSSSSSEDKNADHDSNHLLMIKGQIKAKITELYNNASPAIQEERKEKQIIQEALDLKSKELDLKSKELDLKSKEADLKSKEADLKSKEADLKSKELDLKSKELAQQAKRIEELERRLAEKEKNSPVYDEQSPPESPPEMKCVAPPPKSSAFFPAAESTASESKKRKREEEGATIQSKKRM